MLAWKYIGVVSLMRKPSGKQKEILDFVRSFMLKNHGHSPTYREIQNELGLSSPSVVNYHLKKLEENNYIRVNKTFKDKKPLTTHMITKVGIAAFKLHISALEKMIKKMK